MITIRAWTKTNHPIEWNYDATNGGLPEAMAIWTAITRTGRAPAGDGLSRAYYWSETRKPGESPDKVWAS